jgi:hypothetical protein
MSSSRNKVFKDGAKAPKNRQKDLSIVTQKAAKSFYRLVPGSKSKS